MSNDKSPWRKFWDKLAGSQRVLPKTAQIADNHVDQDIRDSEDFKRDAHYFAVYVNEMYLDHQRKWFKEYDPMVLSVAEFNYDGKTTTVPFIVGPQMLEEVTEQLPSGMVYSNTKVAGIHPYKGGSFALSMVLNSIQRKDHARDMLRLVEKVGGSLDFASSLTAYTKLSGAILDGVESLMGLEDSKPLAGRRHEFNPDFDISFKPKYFVLIDTPEEDVDKEKLWVKDYKLHYGDMLEDAQPYRSASYVLYSIKKADSRSDTNMLSFYPLYKKMLETAGQPDDKAWKSAKSMMLTLTHTLAFHPDLASKHAEKLMDRYMEEMVAYRKRAEKINSLGPVTKSAGGQNVTRGLVDRSVDENDKLSQGVKQRLDSAVDILDL
ncbi:MAG: hypothetical protein GY765_08245 [bacterium]|nr:hypothetical protein [bacterium]